MFRIIITFCFFSFSYLSIAASSISPSLGKDDFTRRIDSGLVSFNIMPIAKQQALAELAGISDLSVSDARSLSNHPVVAAAEKVIISDLESKYSFFDKEMINLRYIEHMGFRYSIWFDFFETKKCLITIDKLDNRCGNPICDSIDYDPRKHQNVKIKQYELEDKYCEKVYNIKIPTTVK